MRKHLKHYLRQRLHYFRNPDVSGFQNAMSGFEGGDQLANQILDGWTPTKARFNRYHRYNPETAMKCLCGKKGTCEGCGSCWECCDCPDRPCECGDAVSCSMCRSCGDCCRCYETICNCGRTITCRTCVTCPQCCICSMPIAARNPEKVPYQRKLFEGMDAENGPRALFMSTTEIFDRIDKISQLVATKGHLISEAAKARIGEELVRLGYELVQTPN